jgi:dsRNA-specific ribonuclease
LALGLDEYLVLGRTERLSGGAGKQRILANLFEAVLGALYLDGGFEPVEALVLRCFADALDGEGMLQRDPKTRFQEWAYIGRPRHTPRRSSRSCRAPSDRARRTSHEPRPG